MSETSASTIADITADEEWQAFERSGGIGRIPPTRSGWAGVVRSMLTRASHRRARADAHQIADRNARVLAALVSRAMGLPLDTRGVREHLGLSPEDFAAAVRTLAESGLIDPGSRPGRVFAFGPTALRSLDIPGVALPTEWHADPDPSSPVELSRAALAAAFSGTDLPDDFDTDEE